MHYKHFPFKTHYKDVPDLPFKKLLNYKKATILKIRIIALIIHHKERAESLALPSFKTRSNCFLRPEG
jgi:hypothetical protein